MAAPASGLLNTDYWTLSTLTNNIADVGVYTVTITVAMVTYTTVLPITVSYTLTVVDPCSTAVIDPLG